MVQFVQSVCCPYCQSNNFIRRGKVSGIQRYQCKLCRRSFRDTTLTALHHLHKKGQVEKYLQAMYKGMSVRKAAQFAGVSKNTSFAWRHKLLSSIASRPQPKEEKSVAGATIIRLPYSAKGRKKIPEIDRHATKSLLLATKSQIWIYKINNKRSSIHSAQMISRILKESHLSTDKDSLLTRAVKLQSSARQINLRFLKNTLLHTVLTVEDQLHSWMKRFCGVATKYLQHYWSWFACLTSCSKIKEGFFEFNKLCTEHRCLEHYKRVRLQ